MDLIKALKGETAQKEFVFKDFKVVLRTLKRNEFDEVVRRTNSDSLTTQIVSIKRPILGYSLESINGIPIISLDDVRNKMAGDVHLTKNIVVEEMLGNLDTSLIDVLYSCYDSLAADDAKQREELKKDSATPHQGSSGDSSKK